MSEYIIVPEDRVGIELDEFLALTYPKLNKGFLRREVRTGHILVDGEAALPSHRLRDGEVLIVEIDVESAPDSAMEAEPQELTVLYEDDAVLVIDKPAGISTEPERWARDATNIAGSLSWHAAGDVAPGEVASWRPRLVHRLDKDTSGALIAAKELAAERRLRKAFEEGAVEKHYLALVEGEHPLADDEEDVVDLPLAPDRRRGGIQRVHRSGKPSETRVRVERRFRGYTLLRCRPITGRTHQIRVHLAETGFPLVVDPYYGRRDALLLSELKRGYRSKPGQSERALIDRLTLHAARIAFPSASGDTIAVEAPLPADFGRVLKQLGKTRPLGARRR